MYTYTYIYLIMIYDSLWRQLLKRRHEPDGPAPPASRLTTSDALASWEPAATPPRD